MSKKIDEKVVAVSGYFLWLHVGHIRYFREASEFGKVVVILNNDIQQELKYGEVIVPQEERAEVLESIEYIYRVFISKDYDETVRKSIRKLKPDCFLKGGDWTADRKPPEVEVCEELGIPVRYNVGGGKVQSSSKLIKRL